MSTHKIFYEYTQMCPHSTTKYTMNIPWNTHVKPRNACEHSTNYLHSPTKYTANIPWNAGDPIHRARIFLLPFHILLQTKSEKSKAGNP